MTILTLKEKKCLTLDQRIFCLYKKKKAQWSYDYTSQYTLNVLNRSKNSKMNEIGLKSGKIAKIRWNRVKTRFHHRFNAFSTEDKMWITIPSNSRCPAIIGLLHTHNKSKTLNTFFLYLSSSTFTQTTQEQN